MNLTVQAALLIESDLILITPAIVKMEEIIQIQLGAALVRWGL